MTTYKEQQEGKKYLVLVKEGEVIGTFGNLKKLSDYVTDEKFYKYNTLIRKEFPIVCLDYIIYKVDHH
ncbi:hypothetical protein GFO_3108 [Christiangramia forsetii KT0803]|uniref:Uncharacterized protein n=2 Tax=Christiangramia forsetii TaxID=411153 RepID=A0M607_CHRFK|nr:hypothetical protein GCM10011532_14020 [Christiangramia forsetii]CAL68052.1 hypothetical protein GFO_3108 [Christiangramia forsetii KT0803]